MSEDNGGLVKRLIDEIDVARGDLARVTKERDEETRVKNAAREALGITMMERDDARRDLATARGLVEEARDVIELTTKTTYLAPGEPGIVARIDAALASRETPAPDAGDDDEPV